MRNLFRLNLHQYFFLIVFLFVFQFCAYDSEPISSIKLGGTYRIPFVSEITCLDPICGETHTWTIGSQILEGLVTFSENGKQIIPLLAESYEINDNSIIFFLRKGVFFHDDPCFNDGKGRNLTASDVKYSFERYFNFFKNYPKIDITEYSIFGLKDFFSGRETHISGLKVIDDLTFQIKITKQPHSLLRRLTSHNFFVIPQEAIDHYGDDFRLHPVGTGPFRFSEFIANEKLVIVKNENYWDFINGIRLPYLDAVEYVMYPTEAGEKMLLDFQTEKIDECTQVITDYINNQVELNSSGNLIFKGWFNEKGVKLAKDTLFNKLRYLEVNYDNKKVRQAINYSINRKRLIEQQNNVFQKYIPAHGPIPPNSDYFNQYLLAQRYDPLKAKKLLKETGYPGGKGLPEFKLLSAPSPDVDFIIEDLRSVGFKIKKIDPFPGWRKILKNNTVITRMINVNTSPTDLSISEFATTPECLNDAKFKKLYSIWQKNEQSYKNKYLTNQIEEMISEIVPVIFLYHIDGENRFLHNYVNGRQLGNAWGHKLLYVWLDK